jgi:hypothetical protein
MTRKIVDQILLLLLRVKQDSNQKVPVQKDPSRGYYSISQQWMIQYIYMKGVQGADFILYFLQL